MTIQISRRQALQALGTSFVPLPLIAAAQAAFPNKPLRIVVPLPASGAVDVSARILGEYMQGPLGQSIVVDNKPGGLYQIGMQALATAPADGHTLIHLNVTMCAVQASLKRYDLLKQLIPVGMMGSAGGVLCISNNAPFKTMTEMLAWAKANPDKLNYGSTGPGSMEHLVMVSVLSKTGVNGNNIPFKGGPDAALALAQGEVHVMMLTLPQVIQFKDKIKPVLALHEQRLPALPDVPSTKELGLEVPTVQFWGGLAAPAGTPKAAIETLEKAMATAINQPALRQRYTGVGLDARFVGTQDFTRMVETDLKWLGDAVKTANLQLG